MERSDAYCVAHQSHFMAERNIGERKTPQKGEAFPTSQPLPCQSSEVEDGGSLTPADVVFKWKLEVRLGCGC